MKKIILAIMMISSSLFASEHNPNKMIFKMYQSVSQAKAELLQTGKGKKFCPACGMNLPMWYKTNHLATHNGHTKQYCSIHCLTKELQTKKLTNIKVVDIKSLKFIDVKNAHYVVGSKKKATMSMISKYAFSSKKDAQNFAKKFGGDLTDYRGALSFSKRDFSKEAKMISIKQAKKAKKGEILYSKICQKTDERFQSTSEAKIFLLESKICGDIKGKKLHIISMFLAGK